MTSCKDLLITKRIETTFYSIMESVERRNVIAKFLDDNNRAEVKQRRRRHSNENGKKKNLDGFRLAKQQLCVCITLFLYISSLHYCDMKLPNFTLPLYGVREHNTKLSFSFSDTVFRIKSRKFCQHLTNKWNWIRSMKFGTVRTYFLSEFRFVVIQTFCYHGNVT